MEELISSFVEIELAKPEDFLKVQETLTRMGVASRKDNKLYQSCHILHKRGHYYIVHFKELFMLDGKEADFGEEDVSRRNIIANLISEWGLAKIIRNETDVSELSIHVKVLAYRDKKEWDLIPKYSIGKRR